MTIPTALWIGTYPKAESGPGTGEGIWRVGIGPGGKFAGGELVAPVASPSFLALDPSGRTLLTVTEAEPGALASFHVSDAGTLAPAGTAASGGSGPCHVVATDTAAWVANYGDGVAAVVPLAADGALGAPRTFPHAGTGPVADRQEGPHAHFVHVWGDRVLVSDLGTDELRTYPLDSSGPSAGPSGAPEKSGGEVAVVLPPGTGPRHLVELPDGTILLVGELDCRLHVLVPAGPGRLDHVGSVAITARTMPDGAAGYPSHITVAGDLVHVGVRGPDVLSVLRVRAASGDDAGPAAVGHLTVENVGDVDLGAGAWPRHHAVLADGELVVVAAQNTSELVAIRLDRASGKGEVTDRLELPVPACVLEA